MSFLIVGLGNIGEKYYDTRHNIGFNIVNQLAKDFDCEFRLERLGYRSEFRHKGKTFHLVKPTTYMNLSGKSVRYWLQMTKIPTERLLVVYDDKALPFGKIRLRGKGGDGGHNGIKNITEILGSGKYPRLRFGIGDNFSKGRQIDYVLGKWSEGEWAELQNHMATATKAVLSFAHIGLGKTMTEFNKKE
ncbi:MAG: aminoacyl-tRNA hydrolase [Chitinophagales bacterium]